MIKVVASDICSALNPRSIGSKVTDVRFFDVFDKAVAEHDFSTDRVPGQAFIKLDDAVVPYVSAGVGPRSKNPDDYVLREHRGIVGPYLKREFAAKVTGCAVVVYTYRAYFQDPDVTPAEAARINSAEATHVLVALLAFAGPDSPLPPYRLVWNLGGGNREASLWTADEIRAKAKAAIDYDNAWVSVAD
jgi:hypothetical protein